MMMLTATAKEPCINVGGNVSKKERDKGQR